jgi:hypothetical protein
VLARAIFQGGCPPLRFAEFLVLVLGPLFLMPTLAPFSAERPLTLALPSSSVASRLSQGWYVPNRITTSKSCSNLFTHVDHISRGSHPYFAQPWVRGETVAPGFAHLPLMYHPKQAMPIFYGRSLHTMPANYNTDPNRSARRVESAGPA